MSIEPTQAIPTVTAEKVGLAIAAPARPSIVSVHAGTGELLRITPTGEVIAPSLEAASEAGRVFVDSIRHHLQPSTPASGEVVAQWRRIGTAPWWDGLPDHTDGGGPYEERTLYAAPSQPAADLVEENARLRQALADLANKINIVGSPYDIAQKALDQMVADVKNEARAALSRYAGGA
jgi:hypothetical protein